MAAAAKSSSETSVEKDCESYVLASDPPVTALDVATAFSKLTPKEKLYAHHMSRACWLGSEIVYTQTSVESPDVFRLLQTVFGFDEAKVNGGAQFAKLKACYLAKDSAHTEQEWNWFVQWCAMFYTNSGNYFSFGDTKFIPRVSANRFAECCRASIAAATAAGVDAKAESKLIESILASRLDTIYSLKPIERSISFPESGISTYYSPNVTKADMERVGKVMTEHGISAYNTRLFKHTKGSAEAKAVLEAGKGETDSNGAPAGSGGTHFELRLASAVVSAEKYLANNSVRVTTGDYKDLLAKVVTELKLALPHAANAHQTAMVEAYIRHFNGGDVNEHKASQRHWIKDVGPSVETNIGFIESYRDPFGSRGEFEGFVAVVNKETSRKFGTLVEQASAFLPKLPWGKAFEKDTFLRPDFTALEVITFAGSGIPAGINIPNYDDIRQDEGFKNVSLSNVLSAKPPNRPITFLSESDAKLFKDLKAHAFEVQVGCHELLGHGSGKLFIEAKDGKLNFDVKTTVNPLTNQPITKWYKAGETYDSVFGYFASSMEECRAELVGLLLSTDRDVLKVFGFASTKEQDDIMYVNWLNMVRAGLLGLEFYTPDKKKWGQAHMQARYGILTALLAAGEGFVKITENGAKDDLVVSLDRTKIYSVGVPAVNAFLNKIQVYKSTADVKSASDMYHAGATDVSAAHVEWRKIVMAKKQQRAMFVQSHTYMANNDVQLQEFEPTWEGVIKSMITRFK